MQAAFLLTAATAAYGSYSTYQAGKEQRKIYNQNAEELERQANDAIERGKEQAIAHRRSVRSLIGRQKAQAAASGIDVNSGVTLDLANEAQTLGAADELNILKNSWREAYGLRVGATQQRFGGSVAYRTATNQATGQALGGLGDTTAMYYRYNTGSPAAR